MFAIRSFAYCVALLLLIQNIHAKSANEEITNDSRTSSNSSRVNPIAQRRQDGGFDFMRYFMGNNAQQQQQAPQQQQQEEPRTPQTTVQQQHLLQQQQLQQHQLRQQEQLKLLQQQQLHELQQQYQVAPGGQDINYQDNNAIHNQYPQQHVAALNRDGGYVGVGNAYPGEVKPREIGFNLGGGKKVIEVGNILTLLPRIFNVLNAGGKVMFGVELGNNFYFGPVGAKPLGKPLLG